LCKAYFDSAGFALDDKYSCDLYYRYLSAARRSDDEELIESLTCREILDALWNNSEVSITVAWSFGTLYQIFNKKGNAEMAEQCKKRMVILINRKMNFYHPDIKNYMILSDEEFMEYMHSDGELITSLNEAIKRKDPAALYLEGSYQEKNGNFNEAFDLYVESAKEDDIKGMCSLALMYYRGPQYYTGLEEAPQDFEKARELWEFCVEKEDHKDSHYWLGILLSDENYEGNSKELAIQHFQKAAKMGSVHAMTELLKIGALSQMNRREQNGKGI
jgi:TPR repeat protein